MKETREKSLIKNLFIISFGTILPKFSSIVTLPIITEGLSKAEYGTYSLIEILVSLFLPFATLQIQSAAFRFLIDCRDKEEKISEVITNIVIFLIPTSIFSLTILFFALYKLNIYSRILICLYFFVDMETISVQQIARGLSFNKSYSSNVILVSIINMILIVFFIKYQGIGLYGLLLAMIISSSIGLIILINKCKIISRIDFSLVSKNKIKEILSYSWPMVPNSLSNWVLQFSNSTILTYFVGVEATAVYSVANKVPSLLSIAQGTFALSWQENASMSINDSDVDEYYSRMFDTFLRILVGIASGLIAFAPILFVILIKGNYEESYSIMPLLFISVLYSALATFLGGIYVALKKSKSVGITTIIAAIINIVVDLSLIKSIGIMATAISALVSYIFLTAYRMIDVKKFIGINYNIKSFIFYNLILVLMCIVCWINANIGNVANFIFGILFAININRRILVEIFRNLYKLIGRKQKNERIDN